MAIYLIQISKSQKVINFKMYSVRDSDTPETSQIMNKYYIAKLDQSKQQGEYCVENKECQAGICNSNQCSQKNKPY